MIVHRKFCSHCGETLELGPFQVSASLISLPSALCGTCGKRTNLSFALAMVSGAVALAVAGASGLTYLGLAEAFFGKPLSMFAFLLMFPIAIVLATVANIAVSSICYVAYNAVKKRG